MEVINWVKNQLIKRGLNREAELLQRIGNALLRPGSNNRARTVSGIILGMFASLLLPGLTLGAGMVIGGTAGYFSSSDNRVRVLEWIASRLERGGKDKYTIEIDPIDKQNCGPAVEDDNGEGKTDCLRPED